MFEGARTVLIAVLRSQEPHADDAGHQQDLPDRPDRDARAARLLAARGATASSWRSWGRRARARRRSSTSPACSTTFDDGTYLLDGAGREPRSTTTQMSQLRNQKIGFVFQSFNLIPDLDVFDNVDVPLRYRGLPAARAQAAHRARAGRGRPVVAHAPPARRSSRAASSSAWRSRARWPAIRS